MSIRLTNNQFSQILKRFDEWIEDGNVITITESNTKYYATQDALYKNRIESKDDLLDYYITEFNPNIS